MQVQTWLQALLLCILGVVCVCAASLSEYPDDSMHYRDAEEAYADADKPVRDDAGLGSLLLKNLRFRDLLSQYHQARPVAKTLSGLRHSFQDTQEEKEFTKRRDMSVNELAQILNNLKARNVDGGVKLQSLRFGRRR